MSGAPARFFVALILLALLEPALLAVATSDDIALTSVTPEVTVIEVLAECGGDLAHLIDAGVARPVSLAAADLDEDGVPDLVVGYGEGLAGHIAVHRGNIQAIYPAPGRQPGAPFLSSPRVFAATARPDFIAAGDFDADGHFDVVTASEGGGVLELHRGDGDGHLTSADQVELGGVLTAMAVGEVNRRDGHPDIVVAVDGATGSSIVVFESPLGALRGIPETIPIAETVTSLELGNMDDDHFRDILALSESYETTVTGRDRRLSLGAKLRAEVPDAMVSILPRYSTTKNSTPGIDLDLDGEIVAQLAMRLNRDAFPDFVVITDAAKQPVAVTTRTRATFTVNSTADDPDFDTGDGVCDTDDSVGDGPCTLRAAIEQANVSAGADAIEFDISGAPPHVIQPASRLPLITEAITIDGTTEPDFVDAPVVELDGLVAGTPGDLNGLQIESAGNSTIRGLSIYRFDQTGIVVRFVGQNIVEGCIVGTDATGAAGLGNGAAGIGVYTCSDNTIGGTTPSARNIASGNSGGIDAAGESNTIQGNFVGTDPTGTSSLANTVGIYIRSPNNTVGGITAGAANVISGNYLTTNQGTGLWISGNSTVDVLVHGNLIGTDAAGTAPLGNEGEGVRIKFSDGIVIGGTSPAMRNVISDNFYGIETESTAANAQIQGNFIGTDVSGTVAVGNLIGVAIASGDGCTVGGAVAGAGNVVSGNDYGVSISTSNNIVQGNLIGTDATGTSALPNARNGVGVGGASNLVGGTDPAEANVIAFNDGHGVQVPSGTGHSILGNSIHSNTGANNSHVPDNGLGIELGYQDVVEPNDAGDPDTGPNNLQNYPVLTGVTGGGTTVDGSLNSTPSTEFHLEFFANTVCDASGHGEGETFLGSDTVTTDGSGDVSFSSTMITTVPPGSFVTATATAPDGSTSEFSECVEFGAELDFGDAPDPTYPTLLASDGARHLLGGSLYLGSLVDAEPDGLPSSGASGDDIDNLDDEDGFTIGMLPIGGPATGTITASAAGLVDGWIDFNGDGDWDDPGEQVFTGFAVTAGGNAYSIPVPATAVAGHTVARIRISSAGGLAPTGLAPDGEVEDHAVHIVALDWGDAPDPSYDTLRASNGAYHIIVSGNPYLGSSIDGEPDGLPSAAADGDDADGIDDEDGVLFTTGIGAGLEAGLEVTAPLGGLLDAWVDFNRDGDWDDADEHVFDGEVLTAGSNPLSFPVPATASVGTSYARFRLASTNVHSSSGGAFDGEVEDYAIEIVEGPDIEIEMNASVEPAPSGRPLTYTITITNNGPLTASSVTLADTLPVELSFVSSTPGSPDCDVSAGTLTCDLGTMAALDSTQVTVETVLLHPVWGSFSNTAAVTASELDPILGNNAATVDTRVALFVDDWESGDLGAWSDSSD